MSPTTSATISMPAITSAATTRANQPDATTSATIARSTSPSGQGSSTTNAAAPEVTSSMSEVAVANQSVEVEPAQARTDATSSAQQLDGETADKLNKIQTQNQTSEASKNQSGFSQKGNVSPVVQTNFAQKQNSQTSSKANQSSKSSQSNQTSKSSLPNTGDVSSLGLGALGAVMMTTSFALKGSKHSRK